MTFGRFRGWICGCGLRITGEDIPLPAGWAIAWPAPGKDALGWDVVEQFPPPGIYCATCWSTFPRESVTAEVDADGARYHAALMNYGKEHHRAVEIQQWTCERLARGKRIEDIMGTDRDGIGELLGAGLHHKCFPAGAPPDVSGVAMVIHPSAMASGARKPLYTYFGQLAARYNSEVHLFLDETQWYLVFIANVTDADDDETYVAGYDTCKCVLWIVFHPDGSSVLLGAS